jgi:chromosomal replication initiator protein
MISPYVYPGIKQTLLPKKKRIKRSLISPEKIMSIVAEHCGVTVTEILSRGRKREVCDARHIFCAVMRKEFSYPLKSIGEMVSGRDHTTAIHSIQTFNDRYKNEDGYKELADTIVDDVFQRI